MHIVIDIPEYVINDMRECGFIPIEDNEELWKVILSGTPLPKGHGDLKVECELLKHSYRIDDSVTLSTRDVVNVEAIDDAPTIIEADKAGEEE